MKIINTRGEAGGPEDPDKKLNEISSVDHDSIRRPDGSEGDPVNDLPILLENGSVVYLPKQVFRGRVAFQFGKRENKLLLVCAWCGKSMGEVDSKVEGISHGMCQACFDSIMEAEKKKA